MQDLFSKEEKIKILEKLGYTVKHENISYWVNVYHNDVEEVVEKVYVVYDLQNNKLDYNWRWHKTIYEQVDKVFEQVLNQKFKEFLLTLFL